MKIDTFVSSCCFPSNLQLLNSTLGCAQETISFWGNRAVTVAGYDGSISIDSLAQKVLKAAGTHFDLDDFTIEERVACIEIRKKLRRFYENTDEMLVRMNWLTRLLTMLREVHLLPYTIRFETEIGLMDYYTRGYSEKRFLREFHEIGSDIGNSYNNKADEIMGSPSRVIVKEQAIKEKLALSS